MEKIEENSWDVKKILVVLLLLVAVAVGFKIMVLDKKNSRILSSDVKGVNTTVPSNTPQVSSEEIKKNVENKLSDLKKEVNNINVVEVATSTPAVQKILDDIKNIQNLPQTQAKEACLKICSGI